MEQSRVNIFLIKTLRDHRRFEELQTEPSKVNLPAPKSTRVGQFWGLIRSLAVSLQKAPVKDCIKREGKLALATMKLMGLCWLVNVLNLRVEGFQ